MNVYVRSQQPEDAAAISDLVTLAFASARRSTGQEAQLITRLRADPQAWLARLAFVAVSEGQVVGYALGVRIHVGGAPAVALAPLAVHPQHQGVGIGRQLVRRLLGEARSAGERLIVVLGDSDYYSRFGFRSADDLGILGPYKGQDFQALPLTSDSPVGRAVYPSAFTSV